MPARGGGRAPEEGGGVPLATCVGQRRRAAISNLADQRANQYRLVVAFSGSGLCRVLGANALAAIHPWRSSIRRPVPVGGVHVYWSIYGCRYRQVVQRPEGLWFHSA